MLDPLEREILKVLSDGRSHHVWVIGMFVECRTEEAREAIRELEDYGMVQMTTNYRCRITAKGREQLDATVK